MTQESGTYVATVESTVPASPKVLDGLWTVQVRIPAFGGQYPTPLYRLSESDAKLLVPGETYNLKLERGRLKPGKDGMYSSDFYWEFRAVETMYEPPTNGPGATVQAPVASEPTAWADHPIKQRSFERRWAVDKVLDGVMSGKVPMDRAEIASWAEFFYAFVHQEDWVMVDILKPMKKQAAPRLDDEWPHGFPTPDEASQGP